MGISNHLYIDKETRCGWGEIIFTLQSSKTLVGRISDERLVNSLDLYPEDVSVKEVFLSDLVINKNQNILFCASDRDAWSSEDKNEICKSITLPAKCPLN